jgi:hypothetical protein
MANKKNFDNVKEQLTEQAKQIFTSSDDENNADIADTKDNNPIQDIKKEPKMQKTIYLNKAMCRLLKKASYMKDIDQSEIAAIALERYFESEGIYLKDGE